MMDGMNTVNRGYGRGVRGAGNRPVPTDREFASSDESNYSHPFGWWGYHWTPPEQRSLPWLVTHEMFDPLTAAFLSLAVEARASIVVVSEPHEAGKTTLLTALLDFLPMGTQPVYLRGWYERFAFLEQFPPAQAYLLCNEISAHLPTYLWGHGVRRMFDAVAAGYPLATTMHATSAADALQQLTSYPLEVPEQQLRHLDLVVTIGVGYASNRLLRRVTRIERLRGDRDPIGIEALAERDTLRGELSYQIGRLIGALTEWHGSSDADIAAMLARRKRELESWIAQGLDAEPSLRATIDDSRQR
jgi:hypothetical protein